MLQTQQKVHPQMIHMSLCYVPHCPNCRLWCICHWVSPRRTVLPAHDCAVHLPHTRCDYIKAARRHSNALHSISELQIWSASPRWRCCTRRASCRTWSCSCSSATWSVLHDAVLLCVARSLVSTCMWMCRLCCDNAVLWGMDVGHLNMVTSCLLNVDELLRCGPPASSALGLLLQRMASMWCAGGRECAADAADAQPDRRLRPAEDEDGRSAGERSQPPRSAVSTLAELILV